MLNEADTCQNFVVPKRNSKAFPVRKAVTVPVDGAGGRRRHPGIETGRRFALHGFIDDRVPPVDRLRLVPKRSTWRPTAARRRVRASALPTVAWDPGESLRDATFDKPSARGGLAIGVSPARRDSLVTAITSK